MVDAGATSHTIKDINKSKTFDDSFQPDSHFIELTDDTRTKGLALKRGDTEICLVDMDGKPRDSLFKRGTIYTFLSTEYTFCYVCHGKRDDYNIQEK